MRGLIVVNGVLMRELTVIYSQWCPYERIDCSEWLPYEIIDCSQWCPYERIDSSQWCPYEWIDSSQWCPPARTDCSQWCPYERIDSSQWCPYERVDCSLWNTTLLPLETEVLCFSVFVYSTSNQMKTTSCSYLFVFQCVFYLSFPFGHCCAAKNHNNKHIVFYNLIFQWNLSRDLKANFSLGFILFLCNATL